MEIPVISDFALSSAQNSDELFGGKSFLSVQNDFFDKDGDKILCSKISDDKISGKNSNFSRTEEFSDIVIQNLLDKLHFDKECFQKFNPFLFVGTTVGGIDRTEKEYLKTKTSGEIEAKNFVRHEAGEMTKYLAKKHGFGQFLTISTACSSGLHAIGLAKKLIENKKSDFSAAIGADALCGLTVKGFESLMLIDKNGSRPFDKNRAGISLGEGAGGLALCSQDFAKAMNLTVKFWIAGYGSSCDAYHATAPDPSGGGAISAITKAIKDAGIAPDEIDWICSHGTGTIDNDSAEIKAYRAVFGNKIPAFCSLKGAIGHTLAASGAIESAYVIEALRREIIPAASGFCEIDENIGIAPNTQKLKRNAKYVLKTAFGFGGNNSAAVIKAVV